MEKIITTLDKTRDFKDETIVLCYGHFNIIHPGHIQYLEFAKKFGSKLVVVIQNKYLTNTKGKKNYFSLNQRCKGVASLGIVDYVLPAEKFSLSDIIETLIPKYFVLGKEHESSEHTFLKNSIKALIKNKGEMVYYTGTSYKTSEYLSEDITDIESDRIKKLVTSISTQKIRTSSLLEDIKKFKSSSLLVIGDTIVDQYIDCEALGMSSEAPVIVVQEKENKGFLGGAAIVAAHARSLGAKCKYISVAGKDNVKQFVKTELDKLKIKNYIIEDNQRPTTYKTRYLVNNQKVFRVSKLNQNSVSKKIEEQIISCIEQEIKDINGILVSDFVYGVITEKILNHIISLAKKNKILLFGDLQCSSQVGNVTKFTNFDLICPTEKEARIALGSQDYGIEWLANKIIQKTRSKNLVMKLGAEGFISYEIKKDGFVNRQHYPALNVNPLDVTGAGDSLLAAMSVGISSGLTMMKSSVLGAMVACLAVQNMGNIPIQKKQLIEYIKDIERYE